MSQTIDRRGNAHRGKGADGGQFTEKRNSKPLQDLAAAAGHPDDWETLGHLYHPGWQSEEVRRFYLERDLEQLAELGVNGEEARSWILALHPGGERMRNRYNTAVGPLHVQQWRGAGITPDELRAWTEAYPEHTSLLADGHTPDEISGFVELGFDTATVRSYLDAHATAEQAAPWADRDQSDGRAHKFASYAAAGMTPETVKSWSETMAGISGVTAHAAQSLFRAGVSAEQWRDFANDSGLGAARAARVLEHNAGSDDAITPAEAKEFGKRVCDMPETIRAYQAAGVPAKVARSLHLRTMDTVKQAAALHKVGILTAAERKAWTEDLWRGSGPGQFAGYGLYARAEPTLEEIAAMKAATRGAPLAMCRAAKSAGFTPAEVGRLHAAGITELEDWVHAEHEGTAAKLIPATAGADGRRPTREQVGEAIVTRWEALRARGITGAQFLAAIREGKPEPEGVPA